MTGAGSLSSGQKPVMKRPAQLSLSAPKPGPKTSTVIGSTALYHANYVT
ncbi:hypothetical protein [Acidocella aminolytica]|nr:hypothetical protein [Acidocella aminolytica]